METSLKRTIVASRLLLASIAPLSWAGAPVILGTLATPGCTQGGAVNVDLGSSSDSASFDQAGADLVGSGFDLTPEPASCDPCTGCCDSANQCQAGNQDLRCGKPGQRCQSCKALGADWWCQGGANGFRCVQPKPNGSPCVDNADCGSQYCDPQNLCATQCTAIGGQCLVPANTVCCEAPAAACGSVQNDPNVQCCYQLGIDIPTLSDCAYCCNRGQVGASCTKQLNNKYRCGS